MRSIGSDACLGCAIKPQIRGNSLGSITVPKSSAPLGAKRANKDTEGIDMSINRFARVAASASIAATLWGGTVAAGPPRVETAFFDGQIVHFLQPAVFSSKP